MSNGYPRFFVDRSITSFAAAIISHYGAPHEWATLFPSNVVARRCAGLFQDQLRSPEKHQSTRIIDLIPRANPAEESDHDQSHVEAMISAVVYPKAYSPVAKSFWQHTGEGISSRRAELCHKAFNDGFLAPRATNRRGTDSQTPSTDQRSCKGPRRYQKRPSAKNEKNSFDADPVSSGLTVREQQQNIGEGAQFIEERYGRNLDLSLAAKAKIAIRRRVAGALTPELKCDDPTAEAQLSKDIKQSPRVAEDDVYLYPSGRIRTIADRFNFAIVVDETIGNFLNVHVLPHADVVVSSLTKVFSGDSNVMGGCSILNPAGHFYDKLKGAMKVEYQDNYWSEDAIFMERNSRDFVTRIVRINVNAEAICSILRASELVKEVYYPKYSLTKLFYDEYRTPTGGYGGLLSVTFRTRSTAVAFYDALETAKGPSLGTNFTLSSPYTLLAHYTELDWAAQYGVEPDLGKRARISYDKSDDEGSERSVEDEEIDQEQESQFRTQQLASNLVDNAAADNGILESVSCSNFMCHGYLEVALGPLINFIIGHNGSGKSAILTAITICLGGKATATNRGQSLKSFIKEGTESAVLSVKIKNKGDSAYQPELYGDSIIVERHFSRSGSSQFKLKSATGRLISTKKSDLEEICDYFALQIDNPMNVLTQDMARQFLSNSTPQEKYKFFMKGTQLEHLDGDYLQIEQSLDKIDQDLAKSLADLGRYEEEARKAKSLYALSEKHDTLRDKVKNICWQMAWAQVEEVERKLALADDQLLKVANAIANAERKEERCAQKYDISDHDYQDTLRAKEELEQTLLPFNDSKVQAQRDYDAATHNARDIQTEQRKIKTHIKAADQQINDSNTAIRDEYNRLEEINGGGNARRLAEMEEKQIASSDAKARLEDHESGLWGLEDKQRRAAKDFEQSRTPIPDKRQEIQVCEERLKRLIGDKGKQEGAYHANLPRLQRAIRDDGGFHQKPIGPIGYHVRLLQPSWSSILEKSLGAALNSFVVTSKADQARLSSLMTRMQCQYPIMIGNNSSVDTTNHEPDPEFDTSLRVLEIDDDLVRKQLIINQMIEQTILIDSRPHAVNVMSDSRLQNVKQCFTHNVRPGTGIRFSYGWGGGLSENYIPAFQGSPRMKTDVEFQVNACRAEIQRLRSELSDLERIMRERQTNLKNAEQAITRHRREAGNLRVEVQRLTNEMDGLQEAIDRDSVEEGGLEVLKKGLDDAKIQRASYEAQYGDSVVAMDKAREPLRTIKEQMKVIENDIANTHTRIKKAETKCFGKLGERDVALREKNIAVDEHRRAREAKIAAQEARADHAETVAVYTGQASEICARVAVDQGETCASLEKKLEKLQADLKRWETQLGGTREEIAEAAARKVQAFQRARAQVADVEKLAQLLKTTLVNRKERWKVFQRAITARARVQFMWMLSERSFRGRLLANHKEKKLDLNVEPDPTKVGKGREAKTLSGGEKSFSTICLLLSLWDAMGAPVRCLDEFDVFMDSVNREVSMRKMIEAARYSIGKQFILITPGSMGSVSSSHDVKIIKMKDPERGQTAISFPNQ
ncbi:MAG: hypothetical protein Q9228_000434 [Teloschistes exilis]